MCVRARERVCVCVHGMAGQTEPSLNLLYHGISCLIRFFKKNLDYERSIDSFLFISINVFVCSFGESFFLHVICVPAYLNFKVFIDMRGYLRNWFD